MDCKAVEAELKALWIAELGEATLPPDIQWHRWRFDFGEQSIRHAIAIAVRKLDNTRRYGGAGIEPLGLWKITTAAAKRHSTDSGYEKPWSETNNDARHSTRYTSEPLPMGDTSKRKPVTFAAPEEWRDADDHMERIVVPEWSKA